MYKSARAIFGTGALALVAAPTAAQDFSGTGLVEDDPVYVGGTNVATFTTPNQAFSSYSENGIAINAGRISSSYANNFNSYESYYDNDAGNLGAITISISDPINAFAFNGGRPILFGPWILSLPRPYDRATP